MKTLLSFLFVLFMVSPSSSQTVQTVAGFWIAGKNDSTVSAGLKFEEDGKFEYRSFDSVNFVVQKGTWEVSNTHSIKIVIRTLKTKKRITFFRTLEEEYSFMLDKSTKENEQSPQKVLAKIIGI